MNEQSRCSKFLTAIDVFSYVPVPHTFPVSSTKSKVASIVIIAILVGYIIFDFYQFIANNVPIINGYTESTPNGQIYQMPQFAFGFIYGLQLNQTLNDPSYFQIQVSTIQTYAENGQLISNKTSQSLSNRCQPSWLGEYNNYYQNLTCVDTQLTLKNPPLKRPESIVQRITISICNAATNSCKSEQQIKEMTSGGRIFLFINQIQGFNFNIGQISETEYPFEIYQFFLVPGIYNRVEIQFQQTTYLTYPTYLTSFTTVSFETMKSKSPVSLLSDVSIYNDRLMLGITMSVSDTISQIQIHYQTLIQHVSQWGALASLFITILGLCCLAYNKRKFLLKNPGWEKFDESLAKKFDVEMTKSKREDEGNVSGLSDIRRQVELQYN